MAKKKKKNQNFKIPPIIIKTGKFLQFFSADLTTSFVRFLFQKPINHKMPAPERPYAEKANISFLPVEAIGKKIAVYQWGNGTKKALITHGWSGRATQMYKIIEALLEQGYTVYSFDGPAHGKSTGKKTMMPEFIKSVEAIAEKYGPFDLAIGHSLGGIATLNAQGNAKLFDKIVVIGTPDSIKNIFYEFVKKLELKTKIAEKLIHVFEKMAGKSIESFHGSFNAKKIEVPTLVIHDTDDKEVPISDAKNNYKHLKNGTFMQTEKLGHNRILKNNDVIKAIVDFTR